MSSKKTTKKATTKATPAGPSELERAKAALAAAQADTEKMRELALAVEKEANEKLGALNAQLQAALRKVEAIKAFAGTL